MASVDVAAASPQVGRVERFRFQDDGCIPNSPLPVLVYRAVWKPAEDLAEQIEATFAHNDWTNSWQAGIYDYTHFHSNTHEVLGIARGRVKLRLGGDHGASVDVEAGDVVILPAGTGHRCEGASDLLVVGAYPDGRDWDVQRGDPAERQKVLANLAQVPLPARDPVAGEDGPLLTIWA